MLSFAQSKKIIPHSIISINKTSVDEFYFNKKTTFTLGNK